MGKKKTGKRPTNIRKEKKQLKEILSTNVKRLGLMPDIPPKVAKRRVNAATEFQHNIMDQGFSWDPGEVLSFKEDPEDENFILIQATSRRKINAGFRYRLHTCRKKKKTAESFLKKWHLFKEGKARGFGVVKMLSANPKKGGEWSIVKLWDDNKKEVIKDAEKENDPKGGKPLVSR